MITSSDKVFFIRHNLIQGDNPNDIVTLFNQKRIAIRFDRALWGQIFDQTRNTPNLKHIKASGCTVSSYKTAINYFNEIVNSGAYVFAEYMGGNLYKNGTIDQKGIILSKVEKGEKITPSAGFGSTIKLDSKTFHKISYAVYPVLSAIRPIRGTICQPSVTYRELANHIIFGIKPSPSTNLLHTSMAEQMCVEYLRKIGVNGKTLEYCILRPGKSLATIDICGVLSDGEKVFAQVKNSTINTDDLNSFVQFAKGNTAGLNIVFSKDKQLPSSTPKSISLVNVDDVFKKLSGNHMQMLEQMIGF